MSDISYLYFNTLKSINVNVVEFCIMTEIMILFNNDLNN